MGNISDKDVGKIKTHILCSVTFLFQNLAVYEVMEKILYSRTGHRWQYETCALPAGYL